VTLVSRDDSTINIILVIIIIIIIFLNTPGSIDPHIDPHFILYSVSKFDQTNDIHLSGLST